MSWWWWVLLGWAVGLPLATLAWCGLWCWAHRGDAGPMPARGLTSVSGAFTRSDVGQVVRTSTGERFRVAAVTGATSVRLVPCRRPRWRLVCLSAILGSSLALLVEALVHGWMLDAALAGALVGVSLRATVLEFRLRLRR